MTEVTTSRIKYIYFDFVFAAYNEPLKHKLANETALDIKP